MDARHLETLAVPALGTCTTGRARWPSFSGPATTGTLAPSWCTRSLRRPLPLGAQHDDEAHLETLAVPAGEAHERARHAPHLEESPERPTSPASSPRSRGGARAFCQEAREDDDDEARRALARSRFFPLEGQRPRASAAAPSAPQNRCCPKSRARGAGDDEAHLDASGERRRRPHHLETPGDVAPELVPLGGPEVATTIARWTRATSPAVTGSKGRPARSEVDGAEQHPTSRRWSLEAHAVDVQEGQRQEVRRRRA